MAKKIKYNSIPTELSEKDFNEFVLPHLIKGTRGPETKISFFKTFNYILKLVYTGCQWASLHINKDKTGQAEIHYTNIFRKFQGWVNKGCFKKIFTGSVAKLFREGLLDLSVIHGDGTSTSAKKGATT